MSESMSKYRMLGLIPRNAAKRPAPPALTGSQARIARGLLGWTQADLAKRAKVSLVSVREVEADKPAAAAILLQMRAALEAAQVEIADRAAPRFRA